MAEYPYTKKQVDLEEIIANKNPKLKKLLPGFILRYIKKIVHEDFVNYFLEKNGSKYGVDFANASIEEFNIKLQIMGEENIPSTGRYIFAANHPLGGFDGLVLISVLNKHYKEIKFLVNDILMNIINLKPLFLPINKHGAHSRENTEKINAAFESDIQILTFPAGLCSRKIKGKIIDLEWKKSFIAKAVKYKRDIIPVFFSGRNTDFFYNLSNIRKKLGIKANLEMFFLVDETLKHQNANISIVFGKPVSYLTFDNSKTKQEWANDMKMIVYDMGRRFKELKG